MVVLYPFIALLDASSKCPKTGRSKLNAISCCWRPWKSGRGINFVSQLGTPAEYASEVYGAIVIRCAFPIYMQGQLLQLPSNPSQTLPEKNVCEAASEVQNFEAIS